MDNVIPVDLLPLVYNILHNSGQIDGGCGVGLVPLRGIVSQTVYFETA